MATLTSQQGCSEATGISISATVSHLSNCWALVMSAKWTEWTLARIYCDAFFLLSVHLCALSI